MIETETEYTAIDETDQQHHGKYEKYIDAGQLGKLHYACQSFAVFDDAVVLRKFNFPTMSNKILYLNKIRVIDVQKHSLWFHAKPWGIGPSFIAFGAKWDRASRKANPEHVILSTGSKWIRYGLSPPAGEAKKVAELLRGLLPKQD